MIYFRHVFTIKLQFYCTFINLLLTREFYFIHKLRFGQFAIDKDKSFQKYIFIVTSNDSYLEFELFFTI